MEPVKPNRKRNAFAEFFGNGKRHAHTVTALQHAIAVLPHLFVGQRTAVGQCTLLAFPALSSTNILRYTDIFNELFFRELSSSPHEVCWIWQQAKSWYLTVLACWSTCTQNRRTDIRLYFRRRPNSPICWPIWLRATKQRERFRGLNGHAFSSNFAEKGGVG